MSIIIVRAHQIGIDSVTPTNNFSFEVPTIPDGTLRLGRGNSNATTSTIFTVDTSNNVTFMGQVFGGITGMFATFMLSTAPVGWVAGNGGTIGNVGSGATRANVDTLALFTAWWAYTDAQLPILTSAGGASTRGVSAAADWAALKRLTVFDVTNRVIRNAGSSFVNGTKYATTTQPHQHQLPFGWDGGTNSYMWNDVSGNPAFGSNVQTGASSSNSTKTVPASPNNIRIGLTDGVISNVSGESSPNTIAMLGCFKL